VDIQQKSIELHATIDHLLSDTMRTLGAGDVGALGAEVLAGLGAPGDRRERR
jgi:hypothetical protein